jgi:hypothetical protein
VRVASSTPSLSSSHSVRSSSLAHLLSLGARNFG